MPSESAARPFAYNPHLLSDRELKQVFIARQEILKSLISDISRSDDLSPPAHHLVIGQRGMGKSTLLRRLGMELRTTGLAKRFIPLNFAEEQHVEIDRLSRFWLNCLDSLADALEAENKDAKVEALDAQIEKLDITGTDEQEKERITREAFLAEIAKLGRRPVLFVDNLHLLLGRLSKESFQLRGFFTKPGAPIVVGASTVSPHDTKAHQKAFDEHAAAFYDGFKPRTLHRLSVDEVREIIAGLARAEENTAALNKLPAETGRLMALRDLTGGNPRTAFLLYGLFAGGLSEDIYQDLEHLLDGITPLYQSYLEQLPELSQIIVGVLARNQRPMTAAEVTERGSLKRASVSPQLGRLEDLGLVERVDLQRTKKEGYQIAERFFNLWFILRFASRRERARLRCLARFLKDFYTPKQLAAEASSMLNRGSLQGPQIEMALALHDSLDPEDLKAHQLRLKAHLDFIEEMKGVREKITELIDLKDIEPSTFEFAELKEKLRQVVPKGAKTTPKEFVNLVLESPSLLPGSIGNLDRNTIAQSKPDLKEFESLVVQIIVTQDKLLAPLPAETRDWLKRILRDGLLKNWHDAEDLERLLADHSHEELFDLILTSASSEAKNSYSNSLTHTILELRLQGVHDRGIRYWLASTDCEQLGWYSGSIFTLRSILKESPDNAMVWSHLGTLIAEYQGNYEEAEQAYQKAIAIDSKNSHTWSNLGALLNNHLARYDEAEEANHKALVINPKNSIAWYNLGIILENHRAFYEQAEQAYRRAIDSNPEDADPWRNLADLLVRNCKNRHQEAEEAYRRAISINPYYADPWNSLGNLQMDFLGDFIAAKYSFQMALTLNPQNDFPRHNLAFLERDFLSDQESAREVCSGLHQPDFIQDTQALHEALFSAYDENWGQSAKHLTSALNLINGHLPNETQDDWFRAAAVFLHIGYGDRLVDLLKETGAATSLLPFYEAIQAHNSNGRTYLQDIEPEARPAAQKIFDHIEQRRSRLPESTRQKKNK